MRYRYTLYLVLTLVMAFVAAPFAHADWKDEVKTSLNAPNDSYNVDSKAAKFPVYGEVLTTRVEVLADGGNIVLTFIDPMITPKGDTKGRDLLPAVKIKVGSGLRHALGHEQYFATVQVVNGRASVSLTNLGLKDGVETVEHIYFLGEAADGTVGYGMINPKDPFAMYNEVNGKPDLNTLVYGIVEKKDGSVVSLKSLGKGKLAQGRYRNGAGNP